MPYGYDYEYYLKESRNQRRSKIRIGLTILAIMISFISAFYILQNCHTLAICQSVAITVQNVK